MNATEIITSQPVNVWQITPDGRGVYDFDYYGDHVVLLNQSQRAFLITDVWCGGNDDEEECYRYHFKEVDYRDAVEAILDAARGCEPSLGGRGLERFGNAPIWLKQAMTSTDARDALLDTELSDAIEDDHVG